MMYEKSLVFWFCLLPFIASFSIFWPTLPTTSRYQLKNITKNIMKNDDEEQDQYILTEQPDINNFDIMLHALYGFPIKYNYKNYVPLFNRSLSPYQTNPYQTNNIKRINQIDSPIDSTEFDDKNNCTSQDYDSECMKSNINDTYDLPKYFNRNNSKNNIILYKSEMCDDFTCIRLCCPLGNRLINETCIPDKGYFVFLRYMRGYINDSFQNENDKVNDTFLMVVHDPCQKTKHYLHNPYYKTFFLANGSLYLSNYNTIVESTSYCLAIVDHHIFAVKVCFETTKNIISNITNKNESYKNENLKNTEDKSDNYIDNNKNNHSTIDHSDIENNKNNHSTIIYHSKNITSYKICDHITCFRLCCPFGKKLIEGQCKAQKSDFIFLRNMYGYINNSLQNESKDVDEVFLLVVHDPCPKTGHFWSISTHNTFFVDGSLYLSHYNTTIESTFYCLANIAQNKFTVNICLDMKKITNKTINYNKTKDANNLITTTHNIRNKTDNKKNNSNITEDSIMWNIVFFCGKLGVMLSSLMMFLVYFIGPDLRNIYAFILCRYSGLVFVAYMAELLNTLIKKDTLGNLICNAFAFIKYYSFLGSFFWLNVMSFDIWHTFSQFSSQKIMKQQKKKMIYSLCGWGVPFMLVIIYGIIYFVSVGSNNFQFEFDERCWITHNEAYWLYYGIVIISVISSICLSFFTKRKIAYYNKDIASLKDSDKLRYKDKKQWFKLNLKITKVLFIIICIKTCININMLDENKTLRAVRYTLFTLNVVQYFYIFVIFVWNRRKIKQLLLKRFGCKRRDMLSATQPHPQTIATIL